VAGRPTTGALVLAAACLAALLVSMRAWAFLCDDAFISFRYAANLAEHGSLSFNPTLAGAVPVEGYTNFLWVVLLAAGQTLGIAPPDAAPALTRLSILLSIWAVVSLVRSLRGRFGESVGPLSVVDLLPVPLLCVVPEFVVWSHSGLETAAATAAVLGAMWAWTADRPVLAAGLAAAAALTRPDALLAIGVFGVTWLVVVGGPELRRNGGASVRALPWRRLGLAALVFVVPVLGHLLWRHAYYGQWLPNTWAIKANGRLLRDTWGADYVAAWAQGVGLLYLAPLVLLVRPRHTLLLLPTAAVVAYAWWVGGDFMAYGRFVHVATACLLATVGWVLADACRLARRFPALSWAPVVVVLALAGFHAQRASVRHAADRAKPTGWIDGRWEGVTAMDRFARTGWAVGDWMRDHLPPQTRLTVGAAGAVPYASGLPTLDAFGLVDPDLAHLPGVEPMVGKHARPGHQLYAPPRHLAKFDADLACHVGYRGPTRPTGRHVQRGYVRGYTWACIEPESRSSPTLPPGELLDVGFYCCRRPRDRVVGPFGGPGA
jgi:arabinofuranosyltransferase